MKHVRLIARTKPLVATSDVWCQVAVVLGSIGLPVPKDLVDKCLGLSR